MGGRNNDLTPGIHPVIVLISTGNGHIYNDFVKICIFNTKVILLKPGPGAIKHENFLKYEKILNCHGNVEMPTYNWLRMKISINLTMHIVRLK
jgi:hypothetical protein